jgi:putative transposase
VEEAKEEAGATLHRSKPVATLAASSLKLTHSPLPRPPLTTLSLPTANTEMIAVFLAHVAQEFRGYFVTMLLDRAIWHTAKRLSIPENIRLLLPPAWSPDLNPAEHIWEDLREKILPNMTFPPVGRLIHRLCVEIKHLGADPERVRSMTDFPYLRHPS